MRYNVFAYMSVLLALGLSASENDWAKKGDTDIICLVVFSF